jgi:proton-coupled amino acid transporter
MLLLAKVNLRVPGSFGDIGQILMGRWMRYIVLGSIVLSQMGFCASYMVFVSNNATELIRRITGSDSLSRTFTPLVLIAMQVAVYIPMALVRRIKTFAVFSLTGDAFILFGLGVVSVAAFQKLSVSGIATDIVQFNPKSFSYYIGTCVFTFEGVGLVIPISQSMRHPEKFGQVLIWTMVVTTSIYIFVASIGYLAWGENVTQIVLKQLPENGMSIAVTILYILAITLTWPLAFFPALRIVEQGLLPHADGKQSFVHKWQKNILRSVLVTMLGGVAVLMEDKLGLLVSLIGSFACVPLSFIYPAIFHLKVFPEQSLYGRLYDWFLIVFGALAMVFCTIQIIFNPESGH